MNRFSAHLDLERHTIELAGASAQRDGCRVACRGYIANAGELHAEARRRNVEPPVRDEDLFALAYRWWGEGLQGRVLGEYAVVLYDERERRLLLTHDALGLVPCFFAMQPDRIIAGSHLDDVARAAGPSELDDGYVADLLALGRPSTGRTPYRAVRRLMPGRTLTCTNGRVAERTTWQLSTVRPVRLTNDGAYEERARELIAEGVRTSIPDTGTTWCELSGGLDSSTVISVAAALCNRPLPALSSVYEHSTTADERPWMQAVLKRYALPWHPIDVDATPPFAAIPLRAYAEPNATMPVPRYYRRHVELLAQHGVDVVLTGVGGDNVFAGDAPEPRHLGDPLARCDAAGFVRGLRDWKQRSPTRRSMLHWLAGNVVQPAWRHALGRSMLFDGSASYTVPGWVSPSFARATDLHGRMQRRYAPRCPALGDQYVAESLYVLGTIAGTHRDVLAERFTYRNPLLYRPLVEFMYAIPWEQRLQPDCDRVLQRRALTGILPEKIRRRRNKSGAQQAYYEGLRRPGPWLDLLRRRPLIVEHGYVDARAWREAVEQARFGHTHTLRHFISAATLECWLRQRDQTTNAASGCSQGEIDEPILFNA